MNTTKTFLILLFVAIAATMHAQSANEFAAQYKGQEGINYQDLTAFVNEVNKRFEQMPADGIPGEMPEGVPTLEEFKTFYNKIKTMEIAVTDNRQTAFRMFGAIRRLENYVPLIIYTDEVEVPEYVDSPDNVRRLRLPAAYRVEGFIYQAFGRVDEKNLLSDLIVFNSDPNIGMATCITGQLSVEDLRIFYSIQQMMQRMQRMQHNQQPGGPRP